MTDRPIIFSAPMVRALLAGSKTQTRRLATSPLRNVQIGDLLYVREHWSTYPAFDGIAPRDMKHGSMIYTRADDRWHNNGNWIGAPYGKHRQGMHMPRWASRLTLIVTDVRSQPLQAINDGDARAEGVEPPDTEREDHDWSICPQCGGTGLHGALGENLGFMEVDCSDCDTHLKRFRNLWDSLHDKPGERWADNPEIVALTFEVHRGNIDRMEP